jgi:hypothetical protein
MTLQNIKEITLPILKNYGIAKAFIFGSYARGEQREDSDIDLLIEYKPDAKRSLFTLARLKIELEEALQRDVDVVTENALSPYIRESALKSKQVIM